MSCCKVYLPIQRCRTLQQGDVQRITRQNTDPKPFPDYFNQIYYANIGPSNMEMILATVFGSFPHCRARHVPLCKSSFLSSLQHTASATQWWNSKDDIETWNWNESSGGLLLPEHWLLGRVVAAPERTDPTACIGALNRIVRTAGLAQNIVLSYYCKLLCQDSSL